MSEHEKSSPKQCSHLNIIRVTREMLECDFRCDASRVRGTLAIRVLAAVIEALKDGRVKEGSLLAFLKDGAQETNLAPGATVIDLETFAFKEYLPKVQKPKLKERSYATEVTQVQRLVRILGKIPVHEIRQLHALKHKSGLLALGLVNNTIRKDLFCLSRIVEYAMECGLVKLNPLLKVKGLPLTNRSAVWLRLGDIVKLLWAADRKTRSLILFLILTGARIREALEFKVTDIDWKRRVIRMPTEKRRGKSVNMRTKMRTLKIDSLGSRFIRLLKIMRPHPATGYFFCVHADGRALHHNWAEDLIRVAVKKAGLGHLIPKEVVESGGFDHVIPHDCRRTFTMHRVIAGISFNQLRAELGQIHAQSIQSYLDESENHDPSESIFFQRQRKSPPFELPTSAAAPTPSTSVPILLVAPPSRPLPH